MKSCASYEQVEQVNVISNFEFLMLKIAFNNNDDIRLCVFPLTLFIFSRFMRQFSSIWTIRVLQRCSVYQCTGVYESTCC